MMEKQTLFLWQQFEKTGSIEDYLHYQTQAKRHTASQHRQHRQHRQMRQMKQRKEQSQ